jgi:lipid-A-disaccharide synthase
LPELLRLRKSLAERWLAEPPAVFIGIDAPEFNLGLEERLRAAGIATVHFVSPSVWAWRRKRIFKIRRAVDLMLTLFPFEQAIYREHGIPVRFVGHPLADEFPLEPEVAAAREALKLPQDAEIVAVLPGSRGSELKYLSEPYIRTMQALSASRPELRFVVPLVNAARRAQFEQALARFGPVANLLLLDGQSRLAMTAADAVLLASGTATLEAMLLKKPMVVGYRVSAFSHFIFRRLLTIDSFALPNLLAGQKLVPEWMQEACTPENLAASIEAQLALSAPARAALTARFAAIHQELRCNAGERAAAAVAELLAARIGNGS